MPKLLRKHYFRHETGVVVGAIYEWKSRAAGEAIYQDEWRSRVTEHYGTKQQIRWLETPIVVDNVARCILKP